MTREIILHTDNGISRETPGIITPELQKIMSSKTWAAKGNSRIVFDSPEAMLTPFIERLEGFADTLGVSLTSDFSHEVTNLNDDDTRNTAYGRVKVEATIGREAGVAINGHAESFTERVGMVYAFDLGLPEIILYHGTRAKSCLNLMVFGTTNVQHINYLKEGIDGAIAYLDGYARNIGFEVERQREFIERLMRTNWTKDQVERHIGAMLIHVVNNNSFGAVALNAAVKSMTDPSSRYALRTDGSTTAWNFLQALTQNVTDKAYLNVGPAKTLQMTDHILSLS